MFTVCLFSPWLSCEYPVHIMHACIIMNHWFISLRYTWIDFHALLGIKQHYIAYANEDYLIFITGKVSRTLSTRAKVSYIECNTETSATLHLGSQLPYDLPLTYKNLAYLGLPWVPKNTFNREAKKKEKKAEEKKKKKPQARQNGSD